jgi:hypothetical protein
MHIARTNTTTYKLTCLDRLDPVTVYTENYEPGKGKITIECYGQTWSSYWGAMSGDTVEEFFCRCDEHYLANKLSAIDSEIADLEALSEAIGVTVEDKSAVMWDEQVIQAIRDHYDCEPFHADLPRKTNPDYEYLCRIINNVQLGLSESIKHLGAPKPLSEEAALEQVEVNALRRALDDQFNLICEFRLHVTAYRDTHFARGSREDDLRQAWLSLAATAEKARVYIRDVEKCRAEAAAPKCDADRDRALEQIEVNALRRSLDGLENELAIKKNQLAVLPREHHNAGYDRAMCHAVDAVTEILDGNAAPAFGIDEKWLPVRERLIALVEGQASRVNRPLADFRPDELARIFARASRTADPEVIHEPEFHDIDAEPGCNRYVIVTTDGYYPLMESEVNDEVVLAGMREWVKQHAAGVRYWPDMLRSVYTAMHDAATATPPPDREIEKIEVCALRRALKQEEDLGASLAVENKAAHAEVAKLESYLNNYRWLIKALEGSGVIGNADEFVSKVESGDLVELAGVGKTAVWSTGDRT